MISNGNFNAARDSKDMSMTMTLSQTNDGSQTNDDSWDAPVATRASRLRNLIFKFGQGKTGGQP